MLRSSRRLAWPASGSQSWWLLSLVTTGCTCGRPRLKSKPAKQTQRQSIISLSRLSPWTPSGAIWRPRLANSPPVTCLGPGLSPSAERSRRRASLSTSPMGLLFVFLWLCLSCVLVPPSSPLLNPSFVLIAMSSSLCCGGAGGRLVA